MKISQSVRILLIVLLASGISHSAIAAGGGGGGGESNVSYGSSSSESAEMMKAKVAIAQEDFDRALEYLERVRDDDPNNANAWNLTGFSLRNIGKYEASEKAYTKALLIDPKHSQAIEYMGELYLTLNKPAKAESLLARLEDLCTFNCKERNMLAKAIREYNAKK